MTYPHEQWPPPSGYDGQSQQDSQPAYPAAGQWTPQLAQGWAGPYPPAAPRKSYTGLVITLVIGAVLIALIVFVAPFFFIDKMTGDLNDSIANSSGANTEQILENELEVTFGEFTRTDTKYRKDGKLPVTFRNKSGEKASFYVQVEALDADGNRVAEDTASVTSLSPGQSTTEDLFTFSEDVEKIQGATFRVASVSKH
ncbi:FxLYD domain-containing protein [Mycolicibacterium peregrinum]|uniref:FxLYD domain-containing protein n=1 Tax=Mycolicibacterium peregrinum TaxID=43304 RepID=UPI001041FA5F|nr:FxLYD domain-containing protein [Mycolicibacterium peregrinum]